MRIAFLPPLDVSQRARVEITSFRCSISESNRKRYSTPAMTLGAKFSRPVLSFVTPDNFSKDLQSAVKLSQAALEGGTTLIQIRDRKGETRSIRDVVKALLSSGIPATSLVVNGLPVDEVKALNTSLGIHVKEKDIESVLPSLRGKLSDEAVIGCAVHSAEIAQKALKLCNVDYMQVGTMFATSSHPGKVPEGPGLLSEIRQSIGDATALVAVGGIEEGNIPIVINHGADGVAVVTRLASAEDPSAAAADVLTVLSNAYGQSNRALAN